MHVGIRVTEEQEIGIMRPVGIREFTWFTLSALFHPESPFLGL